MYVGNDQDRKQTLQATGSSPAGREAAFKSRITWLSPTYFIRVELTTLTRHQRIDRAFSNARSPETGGGRFFLHSTSRERENSLLAGEPQPKHNAVMPITYKTEPELSAPELAGVFERSGIRRPTQDLPRLQQMIDKADLILTARDGPLLVGVARSLSDFCFATYLSDLAVDKNYQHKGIGKELVRLTREATTDASILLLIAAPEASEYYQKIGFEKMDRARLIDRAS